MPNYSGHANIEFSVYRDYSISKSSPQEINLKIEGSSYFKKGRWNCRNDDAFEDEGDTQIISAIDSDGKSWLNHLTDEETNDILEKIEETVREDDSGFDPPDDYSNEYYF